MEVCGGVLAVKHFARLASNFAVHGQLVDFLKFFDGLDGHFSEVAGNRVDIAQFAQALLKFGDVLAVHVLHDGVVLRIVRIQARPGFHADAAVYIQAGLTLEELDRGLRNAAVVFRRLIVFHIAQFHQALLDLSDNRGLHAIFDNRVGRVGFGGRCGFRGWSGRCHGFG